MPRLRHSALTGGFSWSWTGIRTSTPYKSFRNLPLIQVILTGELNTYDVLCNDWIVFTKATLPGERGAADTTDEGTDATTAPKASDDTEVTTAPKASAAGDQEQSTDAGAAAADTDEVDPEEAQ